MGEQLKDAAENAADNYVSYGEDERDALESFEHWLENTVEPSIVLDGDLDTLRALWAEAFVNRIDVTVDLHVETFRHIKAQVEQSLGVSHV